MNTLANKQFRPERTEYFCNMVKVVATRGSCVRRKTGCILVNDRFHVLATGYNGKHAGAVECYLDPCDGHNAKSGERLDACEAIHAEANALLQCKDVQDIYTAFVTTAPCVHCIKLLLNTSCKFIVYLDDYPGPAKDMWTKAGRGIYQFNLGE